MFDSTTRNRLAAFVSDARRLLCGEYNKPGGEITSLLQTYGIQPDGAVADLDTLPGLDQRGYELGHTLRDVLDHKRATAVSLKAWGKYDPHVYDLIQEQAFTVLNRLCALRMAEERGILPCPVVSAGADSDGFQLYEMVADKRHLTRDERYAAFLFSVFDELSLDLGVLFDRFSPHGMLFPRPDALGELLALINDPALAPLWAEDETIGWIYQYWNSKEERKAMRDASAAPRNSRELAVRNQFFTPRYVVEFLTDNTLGRIWNEMTKGQTRLAEQCRYLVRRPTEIFLGQDEDAPDPPEGDTGETLSQEELLKQPVHIPHRPVKDPREIRLLDPACGSMHFGLYAFDLFETIYDEFWELQATSNLKLETSNSRADSLTNLYASKQEYLRDVPRLIIENNLHGVDIDPRAVQIAGLSLWLRAQKSWRDTPAAGRPRVRRSNIVCAEPMPGSDAMLEDFVQTLDPPLLGELVKTVFDKMQLAGEAGTLLKIEEEIRTAIDDAKAKWEKLGAADRDLFSAEELNQTLRPGAQQELTGVEKALTTDHRPLATDFFDTAEERIYAALRDYAESAEAGDYQRRLFAEDAAHGFAFIDLCRKRYDAVVMNPPFGEPARSTKQIVKSNYPDISGDILQAFIQLGLDLTTSRGLVGAITARTGFFMGNSEPWRDNVIFKRSLKCFADLGLGVLDDALVEAAAYVVGKTRSSESRAFACRQLNVRSTKAENLSRSVRAFCQGSLVPNESFMPSYQLISHVPGKAFAYWAPDAFLRRFSASAHIRLDVRQGLATADDFRYARLAWEVPQSSAENISRWQPFSKGGAYSPGYDDVHLRVDWDRNGAALKSSDKPRVQNESYYFSLGSTYTVRTASAFTAKLLPKGTIFSHNAQSWFLEDEQVLLASIGYFSSRLAQAFVQLAVGGGDVSTMEGTARRYTTQVIEGTPFIPDDKELQATLASFGEGLISCSFSRLSHCEVSGLFVGYLASKSCIRKEVTKRVRSRLKSAVDLLEQFSITDRKVIDAFALSNEEIDFVSAETGVDVTSFQEKSVLPDDAALGELATENLIEKVVSKEGAKIWFTKKCFIADRRIEIIARHLRVHPKAVASAILSSEVDAELLDAGHSTLSMLIGHAFGRWDIRYATGERQPPELPDPFDPLPVCPPGMLQNADGLPAAQSDVPDDYPLPITWPGILVSDPGHKSSEGSSEDIVARVRDALAVIWGDRSAAIEHEACEILGVRTLHDYFAEKKSGGKFFKAHLKRYSKSRRQAPIYWPLSTESGTYTLWIYYHRLTEDTLYACITNFVAPKQEQAEKTLARLAAKGDARTKAEDKEYEQTEALIGELATFRAELERLAKIWKPNLNDGVQITAAPLWSLFRLKPWQKKLKDTWDKLEAGDYDWAHLAHTLWPKRVIPKCTEDRSLAIAHGYESDLWEEIEDDRGKTKWQPMKDADSIVEDILDSK